MRCAGPELGRFASPVSEGSRVSAHLPAIQPQTSSALSLLLWAMMPLMLAEWAALSQTSVLYNGIRLSSPWPPQDHVVTLEPPRAPYLASPPEVIPIDVGRQLFVDDFLIAHTTLKRTFHPAEYSAANPVLKPDKPWEQETSPTAMVFSDGVWYDPADGMFKMWYMGGYCASICYATSKDGIRWQKPALDVEPGSNVVFRKMRDSTSVLARPGRKRSRPGVTSSSGMTTMAVRSGSSPSYFSPDGIHWSEATRPQPVRGDRSTVFYNPFRKVWVYNLREYTCVRRGELSHALSALLGERRCPRGRGSDGGRRPRFGSVPTSWIRGARN